MYFQVQDVFDFIHNLPGCTPYADEFSRQEIDGQALMLLKEDHLMTAMNIKLGPALKICAKIKSLREDVSWTTEFIDVDACTITCVCVAWQDARTEEKHIYCNCIRTISELVWNQ